MRPLPCNHPRDAVSFVNAFKNTRASKNSNLLSPATTGITWAAVAPVHLPILPCRSSLHLKGYQRKMVGINRNLPINNFISLSDFWSNRKQTGSSLGKFKENRQAVISWRGKAVGNVSVSSSSEFCPSLTPIVVKMYFTTGMSGVIERTWTCE